MNDKLRERTIIYRPVVGPTSAPSSPTSRGDKHSKPQWGHRDLPPRRVHFRRRRAQRGRQRRCRFFKTPSQIIVTLHFDPQSTRTVDRPTHRAVVATVCCTPPVVDNDHLSASLHQSSRACAIANYTHVPRV